MYDKFVRQLSNGEIKDIIDHAFKGDKEVNDGLFNSKIERNEGKVIIKFSWFKIWLRDFDFQTFKYTEYVTKNEEKFLKNVYDKYLRLIEEKCKEKGYIDRYIKDKKNYLKNEVPLKSYKYVLNPEKEVPIKE